MAHEMLYQELPTYYVWDKVPEDLHTKTQLLKERLSLPEDAQPVAIMRSTLRRMDYYLYRREDAAPMPPKREARTKDYTTVFEKRYPSRRAAYLDASTALFELNRYAKHDQCSQSHKDTIYALKDRWIAMLYQQDFCIEAIKINTPLKIGVCFRCDGDGFDDFGEHCWKCGGSGNYRSGGREFWALRFLVDNQQFAWHQPGTLKFKVNEVSKKEEREVIAEEMPVSLSPRKFAEAKALIAWCLS